MKITSRRETCNFLSLISHYYALPSDVVKVEVARRVKVRLKLFPCHFAKREGNKSESKQNIYRVMWAREILLPFGWINLQLRSRSSVWEGDSSATKNKKGFSFISVIYQSTLFDCFWVWVCLRCWTTILS